MATFDDKMNKLKGLVEDFNSQAGDNKVDYDKFVGNLKKEGVFNDATLSSVTVEDLNAAGLPKILARQAVAIVSAKEAAEGTKPYISDKKAGQLTVQQLVEAFDPRDLDSAVAKRLAEMTKNKPCVVFADEANAKVAVAETVANVNLIRDNYPARDFVTYNGSPTKCYVVGERPFDLADENPLFVGQPLLPPEQTCMVTNRSWTKAPLKVRQLARLACQTGEFRNTTENAHNLLDAVQDSDNADKLFEKWSNRYPKAALRFKDLEKTGDLPKLKIARNTNTPTGNDPFFGNRRT